MGKLRILLLVKDDEAKREVEKIVDEYLKETLDVQAKNEEPMKLGVGSFKFDGIEARYLTVKEIFEKVGGPEYLEYILARIEEAKTHKFDVYVNKHKRIHQEILKYIK